MRRFIGLLVLSFLFLLTFCGCKSGDSITLPGEPPEGAEYVAFEVHRNSLEITDAAITWPSAIDAEKALLAVGRSGRALLYPNDNFSTPIFLDTRADLLGVDYINANNIRFCGAHDGAMGTMRVIREDGLHTIPNSAVGNLTDVDDAYVCSDAGEILALSGEHLEPVFQAPEGVGFNAIIRVYSLDRFVVAAGNDGAIFHRYDDAGDFLDESIEDGPDFTSLGIIYNSTGGPTIIYALGDDEIWLFQDGTWSLDYDFAAGTLNDIAFYDDLTAIVVGDNGLILQKEVDGTGWWDDFVDWDADLADVAISPTFDTDGIINLCGSKGEIFKESPTGWEGLNHRAEGPWPALHHHAGESVFATNGNKVMLLEGDDWAEFAV